jgi:unsaturated chondroitin disaccharide hydrolase
MAVDHALTTMHNHVRADGSTYQVVTFNSNDGSVIGRTTLQGYRNDSTWARGQAWALHGFTQAYAYTKDSRFLSTARRTADYFIGHLPADGVPYYDFQAPAADRPKDSSAAAIAASGLLWLAQLETDGSRARTYLDAAENMLTSLSAPPYLSRGTPDAASILLHGTAEHQGGNTDTGLVYGDYYFIEALLRHCARRSQPNLPRCSTSLRGGAWRRAKQRRGPGLSRRNAFMLDGGMNSSGE